MFHAILRTLRGLFDTYHAAPVGPTHVRRLERADDRLSGELTLVDRLLVGDCILCVAGDVVPCSGTVVDGCAAVLDGAFASAAADAQPSVLRYGASVRPGMAVISNYLIVRVEAEITGERTDPFTSRRGGRRSRVRVGQWGSI